MEVLAQKADIQTCLAWNKHHEAEEQSKISQCQCPQLLLVVSSRVRRLRSLEDIPERRLSAIHLQWIFSSPIRSEWVMSVFSIGVTVTHDWWMWTSIDSGRFLASVRYICRPEGSVSRSGPAEMDGRQFQRWGVVSMMSRQRQQTFLRADRHENLS